RQSRLWACADRRSPPLEPQGELQRRPFVAALRRRGRAPREAWRSGRLLAPRAPCRASWALPEPPAPRARLPTLRSSRLGRRPARSPRLREPPQSAKTVRLGFAEAV